MIRKYSKSRDGEKKLSEHFKVKEFACKDGCDIIEIDDMLIELLESLRMFIGKPIKVVSGYRTARYNEQCGGAKNSYHLKGQASDIRVEGIDPVKLAIYGAMTGARGIGIYKDYVHLDTRDDRYVWRKDNE